MANWRQRLKSRAALCALWVALCFGLTSAAYLSWLHRLTALALGTAADWLSMGAGYLLQAAGMGIAAQRLRRAPDADHSRTFAACALLFAALCAPALLGVSAAAAIAFGLGMNLACGIIAGYYLFAIARAVEPGHRGFAFGGGYALATVAVGLLALVGRGAFLHGPWALPLVIALAAVAAVFARRSGLFSPFEAAPEPDQPPRPAPDGLVALAFGTIVLISAVKNLGFAFPSADIQAGLVPELSRLPYALGLAVAGIIGDRDRRHGMLCTMAALILPFIMLGLAGQPVPSAVCWGLDYLFFGFFSVFRAVLFVDIACRARRWELAPLGLLAGRLGDVAGTAVCLLLSGRSLPLIAVAALLFFPAVFLFFRLYQRLYEPEAVRQRSEQEVFEAFCLRNDLSSREREVLRMVVEDRANGEIAEALFVSQSTIKYHVRNILQKTGCKNRNELTQKYRAALYPGLDGESRT